MRCRQWITSGSRSHRDAAGGASPMRPCRILQESFIMNRRLIAASALLAVVIGTPIAAFAQTSPHALTRADVIAQLIQAQRDGTVPAPNSDYPPSADAVARNRELYAIAHHEQGAATAGAATSMSTASVQ
ncbi:hypothetical protein BDAG_01575 [Burkholderia dolosa AU0158]|nr:hypothetical protein BDAG_01575 [Burkholderia dolosa AU0158]